MNSPRKIHTNDYSIDGALEKLGIVFPSELRNRMKERNGFDLGGFRFYCVLDQEDIHHTSDDIVRENANQTSGWQLYLPEGFVAIADDGGQGCLALSTKKDGIVYYWNNMNKTLASFCNAHELIEKLQQDEESIA